MKTIFEYLEYREFLKDLIVDRRARDISVRALSQRAGFKSPNYLQLIAEGKRNLSPASLAKLADYLKFKGAEREFFENLVLMNQAASAEQQRYYSERLMASRRFIALRHLEHDQYEYFTKWYYAAVRELVLLPGFKDDAEWIARTLVPNVTIRQAADAMALLKRLELVRVGRGGRVTQTDRDIGTPPQIAGAAAFHFHREMLERAQQSIDAFAADEREISALTIAVSEEEFRKARRRLREFRSKLHADLGRDGNAGRVYQLNMQFFPLSQEVRRGKS